MNFGKLYGGILAVGEGIAAWLPNLGNPNAGYIVVAGIALFYLADIAETLEDLNEKTGDTK